MEQRANPINECLRGSCGHHQMVTVSCVVTTAFLLPVSKVKSQLPDNANQLVKCSVDVHSQFCTGFDVRYTQLSS